jgi:hypothetical protein
MGKMTKKPCPLCGWGTRPFAASRPTRLNVCKNDTCLCVWDDWEIADGISEGIRVMLRDNMKGKNVLLEIDEDYHSAMP